jgi:hypothetical protein
VAPAYDPIYLGGRDWEDHSVRQAQGEKLSRPPSQQNKLVMMVHACNHAPSITWKAEVGGPRFKANPKQKVQESILKNN